jgi:hypothetical protein
MKIPTGHVEFSMEDLKQKEMIIFSICTDLQGIFQATSRNQNIDVPIWVPKLGLAQNRPILDAIHLDPDARC